MRKLFSLLVFFVAIASKADELPPKSHPDSSKWADLIAPDLSNANFPAGVWYVEDGSFTASKDETIWSKNDWENFCIDLEFKPAAKANSGIVIYATDTKNWIPNSIEVQILDDWDEHWAKQPATWKCGAIFGRLAATKQVVKKAGEWNRMTVWAKGRMIYVVLNNELVTTCDMTKWTDPKKNPDGTETPPWLKNAMATMPTKGKIGLQGKHGGAQIHFRNVKIKQLD